MWCTHSHNPIISDYIYYILLGKNLAYIHIQFEECACGKAVWSPKARDLIDIVMWVEIGLVDK